MNFWTLIGVAVVETVIIGYVLFKINTTGKEIKELMTDQEKRLNEQLERNNAALDTVATGVVELKATTTELKQEIRVLKENNPDLEDEIAKASELAEKAEKIAGSMGDALPSPDDTPQSESPANPDETESDTPQSESPVNSDSETPAEMPGDGGEVSSQPTDTTGDNPASSGNSQS